MDELEEGSRTAQLNQDILRVLTKEQHIDQRVFVSCKPELVPTTQIQNQSLDGNKQKILEDMDKNKNSMEIRYRGINELKEVILTNKRMNCKPKKMKYHTKDFI